MSAALQSGALLCTLFGLVAAGAVLASSRQLRLGAAVLLEFLLAAGLLRLADDPDAAVLATTAAVVGLRRLVGFGLSQGLPLPAPSATRPES